MKIEKIRIEESAYPELLRTIYHPPEILYYVGDLSLLDERCIAVVGSRKATEYGRTWALNVARFLGEGGFHVVSGLADGIDFCAHEGSCETEGGTIAVLGSAIDMEKNRRKREMFHRIMEKGLVISEYPPGTPAARYTFPRRNRIISGISTAVIVVEAGFNSGSLITAELANEQGRPVYAVPGNIDSEVSLGTNRLIRDGAMPITSLGDLGEYFSIEPHGNLNLGRDELAVYRYIRTHSEVSLNRICHDLKVSKACLSGIISVMEIKGIVTTSEGQIFLNRMNF